MFGISLRAFLIAGRVVERLFGSFVDNTLVAEEF